MRKLNLLIPLLFTLSCQQKASNKNLALAVVKDVHSFAEPEKAIVKHLDLDLNVEFSTQLISGKVSWAKKIYVHARPNYHSVAYNTIDELLK
jgi:hypothetical protein